MSLPRHTSPQRMVRLVQLNLRKPDAAGLDVRSLFEEVASWSPTHVIINGGGLVAWYPTRVPYQRVNEFLQFDYVGAAIDEAHRHGIKVFVRLDVSKTYRDLYDVYPDWFRVGADGKPMAVDELYETCMSGDYWQGRNFEIVDELLSRYPLDGIYYNAFQYRPCLGSCQSCESLISTLGGGDGGTDRTGLAYAFMGVVASRIREHIVTRRPDCALAFDTEVMTDDPAHARASGWDRRVWRAEHPIGATSFNRLTRPLPVWIHQPGENARYLSSVMPVQSFVLTTYSAIFGNRRVGQPRRQLAHDLIQAAANGAGVGIQIPGTFRQDDQAALADARQVYQHLAAQETVYSSLESAADTALVYSQSTADHFPHDPVGHWLEEYRGWYQALTEEHIPFDVIDDAYLEIGDLSRYRVVILPNVVVVTDEACARLDEYVHEGGRLLSSHRTSMHRATNHRRADFGLRCLGRRYVAHRYVPGSYLAATRDFSVPGLPEGALIGLGAESRFGGFGPLAFREERVSDARAALEGAFVFTASNLQPEVEDLFWVPPVKNNVPEFSYLPERSNHAGYFQTRYGTGVATYLPWCGGRLVYRYEMPHVAQFLGALVSSALGQQIVDVIAPPTVEYTLHRAGSSRLVIHLVNNTGMYTPRREDVPVGPATLGFRDVPRSVTSLVTGQRLAILDQDGRKTVWIEHVGAFEVLLVEL